MYADETRPLLQGARLTAWELLQRGIETTLICDSMAAQVMREGRVQAVITGADRIAANGDTANKIGTYAVAVLAQAHDIPFYVAAPCSTFDLTLVSGDEIPIEQRDPREVTHGFGRQTAPDGVQVYNPAFDVTPARLIRPDHRTRVITPVNAADREVLRLRRRGRSAVATNPACESRVASTCETNGQLAPAPRVRPVRLHVIVEAELVRMRSQPHGIDFILQFVVDPGRDHVLGEHVTLEQELVVFLQRLERRLERRRESWRPARPPRAADRRCPCPADRRD